MPEAKTAPPTAWLQQYQHNTKGERLSKVLQAGVITKALAGKQAGVTNSLLSVKPSVYTIWQSYCLQRKGRDREKSDHVGGMLRKDNNGRTDIVRNINHPTSTTISEAEAASTTNLPQHHQQKQSQPPRHTATITEAISITTPSSRRQF